MELTLQTVFIMRIYSKYPAKEKMGKEKKKKRGEEERISKYKRTSEVVHT